MAGAVVGGFLFHLLGSVGITGFNIWSMIVAVVGSMVILVVSHAIRRSAI